MILRKDLRNSYISALSPIYGDREAMSIFLLVADRVLGISRVDMVLAADESVVMDAADVFEQMLAELIIGRPVQYVLGETQFCGLDFRVSEGVLIPRPETEELVSWIVEDFVSNRSVDILDIGTGSGCIAVSLAKMLPMAEVSALDISDTALFIAKENATMNGAQIRFIEADILSDSVAVGQFDVIVSNPPYVPRSDMSSMSSNVLDYEPDLALFVEDDEPLVFYRAIARHAKTMLKIGGMIYFEIYEGEAGNMISMLECEGYDDVVLRNDINSKPRMIRCRRS